MMILLECRELGLGEYKGWLTAAAGEWFGWGSLQYHLRPGIKATATAHVLTVFPTQQLLEVRT